ncbi:hypothetical protein MMC25_008053 [Agyrium rufum]|nr:hypothetical protein [Agyrium rufum]
MDETFTLLPLHLDPTSKAVSAPSLPNDSALNDELTALNAAHKMLLRLSSPNQVPPPPLPVDPKLSAAIQKMREQGNAVFRKAANSPASSNTFTQHLNEAIRLYSYGLDMALQRPPWEPSAMVRDEVSTMLSNRAQAQMMLQNWPEGAADAEVSVEMKRVGNAKAWWRRGRCLCEMGRWEDAKAWTEKALEIEGDEAELTGLLAEIKAHS